MCLTVLFVLLLLLISPHIKRSNVFINFSKRNVHFESSVDTIARWQPHQIKIHAGIYRRRETKPEKKEHAINKGAH